MKILRRINMHFNLWSILTLLFAILIITPNISIVIQFFTTPNENWEHIKEFMLNKYIFNTVIILLFTGLLTILIGVSLAWIVTAYDFPFKHIFTWALILPLAIPPYIGAYTYHGILNYTGIIQATLRNSFDIHVEQKYFDIMNIQGVIFIFTLFLFPYVFTITKAFLERQSASLIENARLLGRNSSEIFFRVVIPISRVAIVGGVSLVILEVLNDYGVVKYFGIQTFSTAIFQTWFGLGDLSSAVKLAGILMGIVLIILFVEKMIRGRKQFSFSTTKVRPLKPIKLKGAKAFWAFFYCFVVLSLGFIIPFVQLIAWMMLTYRKVMSEEFIELIWNSILVAAIGAFFIVIMSLIIANFTRLNHGILAKIPSKATVLGYSIPGAVIAIGVLTVFIDLDKALFSFYRWVGMEPTLVLSTSLFMLIFAYIIRFLAIGYNSVETGFEKVGNTFTEASRTLGYGITKTFFKVDIKLIKGAVFGGFILSFVEILKELPLTLVLRPFNFDTLATKAFQYANDEMIHEAALASILIILISGMLIFFFHKFIERETK